MGLVQVSTATIKPDRFNDYLDFARHVKTVVERTGGKNVRLLSALVAGEVSGTVAFIVEADDFVAFGAAWQKFLADPEGMAAMSALNTAAGPVASNQTTLWLEVPL
jgi:hypothetical protein